LRRQLRAITFQPDGRSERTAEGCAEKNMTDVFREIEQGYEAKFKLDEELRFKVRSRRNKLFGLWAADRLGFVDGDALAYARGLVRLELEQPGHVDVADKVRRDLRARDSDVGERELLTALAEAEATAVREVTDAYPMPLGNDHVQVGG
jgi:hypothetical protein